MRRRLGPIVAEQLPGRRVLVHLFSADDIRTLYREEGRMPHHVGSLPLKLYHRSRTPELFANDGLLHSQGKEWQHLRTQAHGGVSDPRTIHAYGEDLAHIADDVVRLIASSRDSAGEVKDCHTIMRRWAFESIVFLTINKRMGVLESDLNPRSEGASLMEAIDDFFSMLNILTTKFPFYRYFSTPYYRRFVRSADDVTRYFFPLVMAAAQEALREGSPKNNTLLANLQRLGGLNQKEIFTVTADSIFAGSETTAAAATYCFYCLAMNSEAQERARKEVFLAMAERGNRRYSRLPYVRACIKEALRFYPPVSAVHRKLDHDVVMSGYVIPKNTVLRNELFVSGRLEENFTRASEFLPERWIRSGRQDAEPWTLHPFASLPFSTGPRMCIGRRIAEMELCTLIAQVTNQNYCDFD
ncbi:hypothetical protein V5799_027040 [Amblyomma americanum]|uniref:Cytochrome n=1 Tax=Amblyomma americanum TaxID=6943 RepID=A0AAQ4DGV2_AMBAM